MRPDVLKNENYSIILNEFFWLITTILKEKDYERFENEYIAYKALKGNHEGDTLHNAVVVKFNA